jgi:hypothetical protein
VVVGVNRYPEFAESTLLSAVGDAEKFAQWLEKEGGVRTENLKVITVPDSGVPAGTTRFDSRPKKGEVHNALFELAQRCKQHVKDNPEDWEKTRLYVYVSGHGLAPAPEEAALLMADSGPDWYGENFPCALFLSFFEGAQYFRELVFLADCCRFWVDEAPLGRPPWTQVKGNNGSVRKMIGFATSFGDPAFEPPPDQLEPADQRRSYFTQALLEGLAGNAVDSATKRIDSNSIARYVEDRVVELTTRNEVTGEARTPQKPEVRADPGNPIVFRMLSDNEVKNAAKRRVTMRFATPFAGDVYLLDGAFRPLARRTVPPDAWVVEVEQAGLYRVHPAADGAGPAPPETANPFRNEGVFKVVGEALDVEL